MESVQSIKNRVKGIAGTRQITQSMRLVSTAKVQKARSRMLSNQPFALHAASLASIAASGWDGGTHRYLHGHSKPAGETAVVALSGDRGLCGGYNVNVGKEVLVLMDTLEGGHRTVTVGAKGAEYLERRNIEIARTFIGLSETPFYEDAREIADLLLAWYDGGEVDAVYLVYTEFRTMLSQVPRAERLLPLDNGRDAGPGVRAVRFEQEGAALLGKAVSFFLASRIYAAMLESAVCEQSARVTGMDAAVKNADDMIARLSLRFNQARQGSITNEIIEIVSGADAVQPEGGESCRM